MEKDLTFYVNSIGGIKGRLTFYKNTLNKGVEEQTLNGLRSMQSRLHNLYDNFIDTITIMESLDKSYIETDKRDTFEEAYSEIETKLLDYIDQLSPGKESGCSTASSVGSKFQIKSSIPLPLPQLKAPNFDGFFESWNDFKVVYLELIHENEQISPVMKFQYLRSALESGKANHFIKGIPASNENYNSVWKSLFDYYENENRLKWLYMKNLYDLKPIKVEDNAKAIQEFIDEFWKAYNLLKSLKINIEHWDLYLTYHICQLVDSKSRESIERERPQDSMMTVKNVMDILSTRARILESVASAAPVKNFNDKVKSNNIKPKLKSTSTTLTTTNSTTTCKYCKIDHSIFKCSKFINLSWSDKNTWLKTNNLCRNCLGHHHVSKCPSKGCRICSQKHHTLFHIDKTPNSSKSSECEGSVVKSNIPVSNSSSNQSNHLISNIQATCSNSKENILGQPANGQNASCSSSYITSLTSQSAIDSTLGVCMFSKSEVLMFTAVIWVYNSKNMKVPCRVLLDTASHSNFITADLCQKLKLLKHPANHSVRGLNENINSFKFFVNLDIESRVSDFKRNINCLVTTKIADRLPLNSIQWNVSELTPNVELADPGFLKPQPVDMLIGAQLCDQILGNERISIISGLPPFRKSVFGFIISGEIVSSSERATHNSEFSFMCCNIDELHQDIKKFWQLEEIVSPNILSLDEKACEDHFSQNYHREPSGRFNVALPFKQDPKMLGDSFKIALNQFHYLERKLNHNEVLKSAYSQFMQEYISLGHMTMVPEMGENSYFLPHHAVIREQSLSTKLRVVFNASQKTTNDLSLNDILYIGPTLQLELFSVFIQFRFIKFALTADISKMYRQINVRLTDRKYQQVLWRNSTDEPIGIFQLNTVTYGTACAPYLAIKSLKQLAHDECLAFTEATQVLSNQFYVDDMLSGGKTIVEAQFVKCEISKLLLTAGFELSKWCSNSPELVPVSERPHPTTINTLGISWNHIADSISLPQPDISINNTVSKRQVLSSIAKLFDPIGLIGPVVFLAKHIMQQTWSFKIDWDDELPDSLKIVWLEFVEQIQNLQSIQIPRCIYSLSGSVVHDLHCFGDASEMGYGAVLYVRSTDSSNNHEVQLLCSKSKVSLPKRHTIPRLELCSALLVTELHHKVVQSLNIKINKSMFWSDSEITIYRINSPPSNFATFVANRVSRIQDLTTPESWHHIPSDYNPADILSRGLTPNQLIQCDRWWYGPEFMKKDEAYWPKSKFDNKSQLIDNELSVNLSCRRANTNDNKKSPNFFVENYSNYNKMLRMAAIWLRFIEYLRFKKVPSDPKIISSEEINHALIQIIKSIQHQYFLKEITDFKSNTSISKRSHLKNLNPFLDSEHVLRVGGRLEHSNLPFSQKHPIIVPKSELSYSITRIIHYKNLHVGPQALLSYIRQQFWLIDGKNICNNVFRSCIRCIRMKPKSIEQLMGQLPAQRVTPHRPFENIGLDFAGPFLLKAVHLEMVEDLTSSAFISTFIRFVNRRGRPANVFSDNATNFVGAKSELKELHTLFESEQHRQKMSQFFNEEGINWQMIPPRSPHFGGLWEASVKSAKHHIKAAVGTHRFTNSEFSTLIVQVEGILNSRPLTPLSNDINDYSALTPGHFLIGTQINSLPEPSVLHSSFNRLKSYQKLSYIMQTFWQRWSNEYLTLLQKRHKWTEPTPMSVGRLVLIREDNIPPLKWPMGRIVELHPGSDGQVRVVTIKTTSTMLKRAIQKIVLLPIE